MEGISPLFNIQHKVASVDTAVEVTVRTRPAAPYSAAPPLTVLRPAKVTGYRPELDVVRFAAFFLVFLHHVGSEFLPSVAPVGNEGKWVALFGGWRVIDGLVNACGMGLCLFFALSAYLITDLLVKERFQTGTISLRNFYIRRALRIWPLYVWGVLLGISWGFAAHEPGELKRFAYYLLFAGNIYCAAYGWGIKSNPMMPLWSISVEEQFYLIWPFVMRRCSPRGLVGCALCLLLLANVTLFHLGAIHADVGHTVWANTFVQFEMFATGILIALARKPATRKPIFGVALALLGFVLWFVACYTFHAKQTDPQFATSGLDLVIGYGLMALGCAAILHGFNILDAKHMPGWAAYLGKISYGLYVYHLLMLYICLHVHWPHRIIAVPVALVLTIITAKFSFVWIERPFLKLKRRFEVLHTKPI